MKNRCSSIQLKSRLYLLAKKSARIFLVKILTNVDTLYLINPEVLQLEPPIIVAVNYSMMEHISKKWKHTTSTKKQP